MGDWIIPLFLVEGGRREEKIKSLISAAISDLDLRVSSVYDSNEEGVKTRNIELDSDSVIDVEKITLATKIINPILDKTNLLDDIDVLDIHSKEKGEENE